MPFTKADPDQEKKELEELIRKNPDAKRAHEEFAARIALKERIISQEEASEGESHV